ncbi:hypothetical protein BpHYR1_034508 [Brachionus plicatilis]|uniref:Uncharacterized protein n=1 Tax=Brachionus plicatilis TaxID=10195 RepID=A0A3M7RPZ5_BRAPC|nr:hypothetical protein BpHYR1_034508 [Brachionus plicatilis]
MADKSFGSFGAFKLTYLEDLKKKGPDAPIDITNVSHTVLSNIDYFQKNLARDGYKQIVNYTWEKPSDESPSIFASNKHDKERTQHTLEILSTYHGHPHVIKQSRWETDPNGPPEFHPFPQKRRTAVLSTMTQYVEEMNKTFPGGQ